MGTRLKLDFYLRDDVVQISQDLLGCLLYSAIDGHVTAGRIIETEAYRGAEDRACHAYQNRRTKRTEVMFQEGGVSYVFLCYGMHHMLNVVTNKAGMPHAILIRAIEPLEGIEIMQIRRKKEKVDKTFTNGPGTVAKALGIDRRANGISFLGKTLWIEEGARPETVISGPRIGVAYAGEDAKLPWRFRVK